MNPRFSDHPGAYERHLQRKQNNPLFGSPQFNQLDIQQAQQRDNAELQLFMENFRELVQSAAELQPNAEADVVLKLKEQLDNSYEQCAGLPGDQAEVKAMLQRLLQVIMQAMWQGVGQDLQAHSKLQMEEEARAAHFALLEHALVADLLRPDSPIKEDELVATLLSSPSLDVKLAMQLFVPEQQAALCQSARALLESLEASVLATTEAEQRLEDMESMLQPLNQMPG